MRSWVLGTGSHGNAVVIESEQSRVLIDAGIPIRSLVRRLGRIGFAPEDIEAVVLTHEHADHARAALAGARAFGWRIFATRGTIAADPDLAAAGAESVRPGDALVLSTMEIVTIPIPHDAAAPVAVVATAQRSGIRTGVAYDLGRATDAVHRGLSQLDVLIVESNHDDGLLRTGPYPRSVANRIAGPHGHSEQCGRCPTRRCGGPPGAQARRVGAPQRQLQRAGACVAHNGERRPTRRRARRRTERGKPDGRHRSFRSGRGRSPVVPGDLNDGIRGLGSGKQIAGPVTMRCHWPCGLFPGPESRIPDPEL